VREKGSDRQSLTADNPNHMDLAPSLRIGEVIVGKD